MCTRLDAQTLLLKENQRKLCIANDTVKTKTTEGEGIFQAFISGRAPTSRIPKELRNFGP